MDRMMIDLPSDARAVEHARSLLLGITSGRMAPQLRADAALVVSELVTNAVVHGAGPVSVSLELAPGEVLVQVCDAGDDGPVLDGPVLDGSVLDGSVLDGPVLDVVPDGLAEGGRGLAIIAALCHRWGWHAVAGGGKAVWALLCPDPPPLIALPGTGGAGGAAGA